MAWNYWTDSLGRTAYLSMSMPGTVSVTGASATINIPNPQFAVDGATLSGPNLMGLGMTYTTGTGWANDGNGLILYNNSGQAISYLHGNSGYSYVAKGSYANASWNSGGSVSITTSDYFNSSNSTTRSLTFTLKVPSSAVMSTYDPEGSGSRIFNSSEQTVGTFLVTLNVPPTYDLSTLSIDTPYIYTGLTTASVNVSNLSAKYGGTITDITFTIGNTSVSRSNAGELSILLDTVGTFTPKVVVTDSRGQKTTKTLDPITVNGYVAPAVSFTADRTLASGVPDDEGGYGTVDATFTYTDVVADLVAPSVVVTDENGTQTTPVVTWYTTRASDGTLSGTISDWSTVARGDTVYGLIPNLNTQYSYQISIRPRDTEGTGTAISQTLSSAFYTVDFLAGGHGIAFGKPASNVGFECAMDSTFDEDVFIDLSEYQTASTTDKAIYDAVVALGWDSDVLIP